MELTINGIDIQRFREIRQIFAGNLNIKLILIVAVQHGLADAVQVKLAAGGAGLEHQGLTGDRTVEIVGIQRGLVTHQGIAGGGIFSGEAFNKAGNGAADVVCVQAEVGLQRDDLGAVLGVSEILLLLAGRTGAPIGVGILHGALRLQNGTGLGRGEDEYIVSQPDVHHALGVVGANGGVDGFGGFLPGHAAHVYTGHIYIVHDLVAQGITAALIENDGGDAGHQNQTEENQKAVDDHMVPDDKLG